MTCGIYLLVTPTGKRYVGSSEEVERRYREHRKDALGGYHVNRFLQAAFQKYGELSMTVLEECAPGDRIAREQHYLDELRPEMNLSSIAGRIEMTPEVRSKLSKSWTPERKAATRAAMLGNSRCVGRIDSPDVQLKRSRALTGRVRSEEHCRRISEAHLKRNRK